MIIRNSNHMKNYILLFITLMCTSLILNAQVIEKDMRMSAGIQNALVVELKGANKKEAEKLWKDFSKEFGKLERDKKQDEYFLLNVTVPSIDPVNPITIFTKFDQFDDMTRAYFWIKRNDTFLNSIDHETEIDGADVFLTDYSYEVEKEVIKEELENEEKNLRNLQKDLEKLEKKNKDLHDDIEKAKDTIRKAEAAIEQNKKDQEDKSKEIEAQKEIVSKVSDKMNKVGKNR